VGGSGDKPKRIPLRTRACAKVNLFLHVIGRRADGYHLLDSLVVFADVGDELMAEPAETLSLTMDGPFAAALADAPDNLVLRAAKALAPPGLGARLVLTKNLPVASGIGGGSADAAATLRLLCPLFGLTPSDEELAKLAVGLGADVPVCLASRPARMSGIGEGLGPAPRLPPCGIVLLNPGIALATAHVFRARTGAWSPPAELPDAWHDVASMAADLRALGNDLEAPAVALQPIIGKVLTALTALPDCRFARMSGSGTTCFGLFDNASTAALAAEQVRRPGWWSWGGALKT
jgi:4-diphosphocytidyl-2-C-methyl-D-erythritol kinase